MQEWEYCSIGTVGAITTIYYSRSTGTATEQISGNGPADSESKAIAKLGEEGWEMVAPQYFKRPKS